MPPLQLCSPLSRAGFKSCDIRHKLCLLFGGTPPPPPLLSWDRDSQGNQHWPRWEIGKEHLRAAELVGEWGHFSILHEEMHHQCVQSSGTGGYNSCHDPTLLPEFHDPFPKLCSDWGAPTSVRQRLKLFQDCHWQLIRESFAVKKGTESALLKVLPPHTHTPSLPQQQGYFNSSKKEEKKGTKALFSVVEKVRLLILKSLQKQNGKQGVSLFSPSPRSQVLC